MLDGWIISISTNKFDYLRIILFGQRKWWGGILFIYLKRDQKIKSKKTASWKKGRVGEALLPPFIFPSLFHFHSQNSTYLPLNSFSNSSNFIFPFPIHHTKHFTLFVNSIDHTNQKDRANMGMKQLIKNLDAFPRAEDHLLHKTQSGALGINSFFPDPFLPQTFFLIFLL